MGWLADWRARRAAAKSVAEFQRLMEVAQTPAWLANWGTDSLSLNEDANASLPVAVGRSRNLWRNNDYVRRYRQLLVSNVLGPQGLRLQMRMTLRDGRPNEPVNDRIETAYAAWGRRGSCEVSNTLEWADVERLCLECLARDGEFIVRLLPSGPHGLQVQVVDPVLLDVALNQRLASGVRIVMGVEIDALGAPRAYWLRNGGEPIYDGASLQAHLRVPADEIIHRFIAEEPAQVRGIPWTATAAQRLWLVRDFEKAAQVASSNAAKRIGFFVSPNGEAPPGMGDTIVSAVLDQAKAAGKVLTAEEVAKLKAVADKYSTTAPGTYDTLPDGYDFRPFESDYPHVGHGEFVKACLRGAASGLGVSYVSLGNDLESVNYSSARVGIIEEREFYKWAQGWLTCALHGPVFEAWLGRALLKLDALRVLSAERFAQYVEATTWQPRRWAGIDPVKEAAAAETNLKLKLTSRRRLILERGEDPDEVFEEIEQEDARFGPVESTPAAPAEPTEPPEPEDGKPKDDETETADEEDRARLRVVTGA
jgi:lambda family phage portal protein